MIVISVELKGEIDNFKENNQKKKKISKNIVNFLNSEISKNTNG